MSKTKTMIVEDKPAVYTDLKCCLSSLGYLVSEIVSSGNEAVNRAGEIEPDLILMDVNPAGDMDGFEAADQIVSSQDIPIIYLISHSNKKILAKLIKDAHYGSVHKPFEKRELCATIEDALGKHSLEKKLKQSEQQLNTTLETIDEVVISIDGNGEIMSLKPAARNS